MGIVETGSWPMGLAYAKCAVAVHTKRVNNWPGDNLTSVGYGPMARAQRPC